MKEKLPNLLALELEEVENYLLQQKIKYLTVETTPPGKEKGQGAKRVISVKRNRPEFMEIIWSYEKYF